MKSIRIEISKEDLGGEDPLTAVIDAVGSVAFSQPLKAYDYIDGWLYFKLHELSLEEFEALERLDGLEFID